MPIKTNIDHSAKRVHFVLSGEIDVTEMLKTFDEMQASVQGRGGYDVLSDNRLLTVPATPEKIRALVERLRTSQVFNGRRAAIVVSAEAQYGMMRMLGSMIEPMQINLQVFWDLEKALGFLDSPAFPT